MLFLPWRNNFHRNLQLGNPAIKSPARSNGESTTGPGPNGQVGMSVAQVGEPLEAPRGAVFLDRLEFVFAFEIAVFVAGEYVVKEVELRDYLVRDDSMTRCGEHQSAPGQPKLL